jgi:dephospho-CoA kinase
MTVSEARQRIAAQSCQDVKAAAADTVIENSGTIEGTWEQVKRAWKKLFPQAAGETGPTLLRPEQSGEGSGLQVLRARPSQAADIAKFIGAGNGTGLNSAQVVNAFGDKAFLLLQGDDGLKALLGWKVENLVARVDEIQLIEGLSLEDHIPFLISEVEEASKELQCEIALIFVSPQVAAHRDLWQRLGYEERLPSELTVGAWQEAALETQREGLVMLFKQLRADRVLRPI